MNEFTGFGERVRTAADLGTVTRKRRREQNLTQEDLALLVASHRNRIQEVEQGISTERLELLLRIMNELGLDLIVRPRDAHRGANR